ncbi:ABC transporter permease [Robertmurraya massiliosenegalensis]
MSFLENSQKQVESDITFYGRGSYDLLVRPLEIESEIEKKQGIVPENYIGFGEGGISISQWNKIQERTDIEIAAPVASLGYFTGINTNIGLPFPEESTRYVAQYVTTDGINQYPISEQYVCAMLETAGTLPVRYKRWYPKFENIFSMSLVELCTGEAVQFPLPVTYHLLVGIDPLEEEKLTGIVFDGIDEEKPKTGYGGMYQSAYPNATLIPVLDNKDSFVPVELTGTIDRLDIGPEDTKNYRDVLGLSDEFKKDDVNIVTFHELLNISSQVREDFLTEITHLPPIQSENLTIDFGSKLNPFYQNTALRINEDGEISDLEAGDGYVQVLDLNNTSQYYRAGQPKYIENDGRLTVPKLGEKDGVPIYREVETLGMTMMESFDTQEPIWVIDPVGEFDPGEREETLASSPLGIYQQAPVTYTEEDGTVKTVKATTQPGSFVTPATSGVTNIHSASLIKGEQPIDAIRVKVAGIGGYTKDAAKKIEEVAKEIEAMGLHVSVVAGASPQNLEVDIEGLGTVTESWTTLGASGTLVSQWDLTNLILSIAFFFVAFTYIINRFLFWQVSKENELNTLTYLGWNRKYILKLLRLEILLLTGVAWAISFVGIVIYQILQDGPSSIYLWHTGLSIMTILILSLSVGKNSHRKKPTPKKGLVLKSMVLKNIKFYSKFIRSPFLQLIVVSGLSTYVYLSLTETVQQTNVTLLGEYVNLQTSGWHFLLIICAYLLAIFTLGEALSSLLTARQHEIGVFRSIGWKSKHILIFYLREITLWSACSILIGNILCIILFSNLYDMSNSMWSASVLSACGFFLLVVLFAVINLIYFLKKDLSSTLSLRRNKALKKSTYSYEVKQ